MGRRNMDSLRARIDVLVFHILARGEGANPAAAQAPDVRQQAGEEVQAGSRLHAAGCPLLNPAPTGLSLCQRCD